MHEVNVSEELQKGNDAPYCSQKMFLYKHNILVQRELSCKTNEHVFSK